MIKYSRMNSVIWMIGQFTKFNLPWKYYTFACSCKTIWRAKQTADHIARAEIIRDNTGYGMLR